MKNDFHTWAISKGQANSKIDGSFVLSGTRAVAETSPFVSLLLTIRHILDLMSNTFGEWNSATPLPRTWWWGERGLVGALFHDLRSGNSVERWRDFIGLLTFSSQERPLRAVMRAHVVVEPSFGSQGFGRPDAVALIECELEGRLIIFFEAKLGTYAEAARAPDRSRAGFNSSINGQLELNHRLALALEAWTSHTVLAEQDWILNTPYATTKRRMVKKREVLDTLLAPISRMPSNSYLHVILTTDSSNPFEDTKIADYMPKIFLADAIDDQWATERSRFGWVGFHKVVELAQTWREKGGVSLFMDNWAFLKPKLPVDDPAVPAPLVSSSPDWSAVRSPRGVSLIFAPRIAPHTYLHFSWRQANCALRDYSRSASDLPKPDRRFKTNEVLPFIEDELPTTIQRAEYTDTAAWHQRVIDANRDRKLSNFDA